MTENQKFCPTCGAANPGEGVFCISCGARFPMLETSEAQATPPPIKSAGPPPLQKNTSDFITLSCPNCGGKLQITPDVERFACQFCGYEHIVRRSGGVVSLEPVVRMFGQINENITLVGNGINRISGSAEKQASEAAIGRIKQEIDQLIKEIGSLDDGPRYLWIIVAVFGGAAVFGWVASYAEQGINSSLESLFGGIGVVATIFTVLMIIGTIASMANARKMIKQKEELIAQKRAELNRHYQVVSQ